jgi:hypothetical protein
MVDIARSDMYHLLGLCRVYIKVRIRSLSESLLWHFTKVNSITEFSHRFYSSFKKNMSVIYHEISGNSVYLMNAIRGIQPES